MPIFSLPTLLLLALLGYVLVTCMFAVLAAQVRFQLDRHEVLRASKQMQLDYLRQMQARTQQHEPPVGTESNVDIVDDEAPAAA